MEENKADEGKVEFESVEEAIAALNAEKQARAGLEKKLGEQGNELGTLRKATADLTETVKSLSGKKESGKPDKPENPPRDFDAEEAEIDKQIAELDPSDDSYQKKLADLNRKGRRISAERQHERTLAAAGEIFKSELDSRDVQTTRQKFLDENPTFNTPEMQTKIKEVMAKDRTGMLDPLAAFYHIQRDEAMAAVQAAAAEKTELQQKLELAEGKKGTQTVIQKGRGPGQMPDQGKRTTGKDADEGALAAIRAAAGG